MNRCSPIVDSLLTISWTKQVFLNFNVMIESYAKEAHFLRLLQYQVHQNAKYFEMINYLIKKITK